MSKIQSKSESQLKSCFTLMQTLKDALGKQKHQKITIKEYCRYEGISYDEVLEALKLK